MHRRGLAETLRCCSDHLAWARRQTTPGGGGARHLRALRGVCAGGSHLRYRNGVPADRSDGEAGLGSRRGFHPPPLRLLRRHCTQVMDTLLGTLPFDPRMSSEVLRAYRQQRQLGWRGLRRRPIIGCSGYPSKAADLDLRDLSQGQENDGAVNPAGPPLGGQMPPMDGPGEEGPNHEPPTGRYGEVLGPAVVPVVRLCRLLPRGATCPIARCLNRPRGRDELTVCAPRQHRTALLSMPRAGPTRRGRGRSRMGTGPAPSTLGLPDDQ